MKINVLGFGVMAKQIAALFYLGGADVCIWNNEAVHEKELLFAVKLLKRLINSKKEGVFSYIEDLNAIENRITIEAVVEDLDIKKRLYEVVSKRTQKPYFTNTSSFSPGEIGGNVNGLHFFNPINLRLAELFISGDRKDTGIQSVISFLEQVNFKVVRVHDNRGYIGNNMLFNEISTALKLIEKYGYEMNAIELMYGQLNGGRNIFNIIDIIGIDVSYKILQNLKQQDDSIYVPFSFSKALKQKIYGKKNRTSIKQVLV